MGSRGCWGGSGRGFGRTSIAGRVLRGEIGPVSEGSSRATGADSGGGTGREEGSGGRTLHSIFAKSQSPHSPTITDPSLDTLVAHHCFPLVLWSLVHLWYRVFLYWKGKTQRLLGLVGVS